MKNKEKMKNKGTLILKNVQHSQFTSRCSSGITLVALVVTIVVLLILAGITVMILFGDNGIIKKAQEAKEKTEKAQTNELEGIDYLTSILNGSNNNVPVTNPYNPDNWDLAWLCTNGAWSDTPLTKGEKAEGDIIAKFYATGNKITPPGCSFKGTDYTFLEGDEYIVVIEGQGNMGPLIEADLSAAYGWHLQTLAYMAGYSDTCIMPYVSEVIICDGITNIGDFAFGADTGLAKCTIGNDVTTIGNGAFAYAGDSSMIGDTVIYLSNDRVAEDIARTSKNFVVAVVGNPDNEREIFAGSLEVTGYHNDFETVITEPMRPERVYRINLSSDGKDYSLVTTPYVSLILMNVVGWEVNRRNKWRRFRFYVWKC